MKDNPLLKNAEQLAIDIETLCKTLERKDNSNAIFQIRKSSSSVLQISLKHNTLKAYLICYRNLKLLVRNVSKPKVG